ncbi:MAG: response regulator [Lachnospiraceae bacterium]|nr:response regulator [Lachnospiraceae bacterium]
MYKVIVVDDEPAALNYVCLVLEKKYPGFTLVGRAGNGLEALEQITKLQPDILITDVQMPKMNGIELVSKVKEHYPDILSLIVSGYSEFEYAKQALASGVCDYLLKPLAPSDIQQVLERLEKRLDRLYYEKRNEALQALCHGEDVTESQLRYFPAGNYYAFLCRRNGLPMRFSHKTSRELFPNPEEKIYIFGRDGLEGLHVIPESLLAVQNYSKLTKQLYNKSLQKKSYVTAITYSESFKLKDLNQVAKKLYHKLDETIVIGKNQLINEKTPGFNHQNDKSEKEALKEMEYVLRYQELEKILPKLEKLFEIWEKQNYSQLYIEARVTYFFQLIMHSRKTALEVTEIEFLIDDAFYSVSKMEEVKDSILGIVKMCIPTLEKENIDDKEKLFHSIQTYLNEHLEQEITLNGICQEFGLSQTTLSRMFRKYENTSFHNYLTKIRIHKAQTFMQKDSKIYIKDIAQRVGYYDQFYFSRLFRSMTGMSPKEYADKIREEKNT